MDHENHEVPKTKRGKKRKIEKVMHEYKHGNLRSGSDDGPLVKDPEQAVAIAMKMAGEGMKMAGEGMKMAQKHMGSQKESKPAPKTKKKRAAKKRPKPSMMED